jgi:hypothetical protein
LILKTLKKWTILFTEAVMEKIAGFCQANSLMLSSPLQLGVG